MQPDFYRIIQGLWIAIVIVWIIGAIRTKRTALAQSGRSRILQIGLVVIGCFLIFNQRSRVGWLRTLVYEPSLATDYLGLILTAFGIALAIWARLFLGRNWSASVSIKEGHEIIRRGPYAFVRHPIYSGFLMALLGTAIYGAEVRGFLGVLLTFCGWWLKAKSEEAFMLAEFGDQYERYQREVKALIPYVF